MRFYWYKDSKSPTITQFGAVGGPEWRLDDKKIGLMPRPIRHVAPKLQLSSLGALDSTTCGANLERCKPGPPCSGNIQTAPHFQASVAPL
eukprot:1153256-Pelagomonas_calceolata.AAC.2